MTDTSIVSSRIQSYIIESRQTSSFQGQIITSYVVSRKSSSPAGDKHKNGWWVACQRCRLGQKIGRCHDINPRFSVLVIHIGFYISFHSEHHGQCNVILIVSVTTRTSPSIIDTLICASWSCFWLFTLRRRLRSASLTAQVKLLNSSLTDRRSPNVSVPEKEDECTSFSKHSRLRTAPRRPPCHCQMPDHDADVSFM